MAADPVKYNLDLDPVFILFGVLRVLINPLLVKMVLLKPSIWVNWCKRSVLISWISASPFPKGKYLYNIVPIKGLLVWILSTCLTICVIGYLISCCEFSALVGGLIIIIKSVSSLFINLAQDENSYGIYEIICVKSVIWDNLWTFTNFSNVFLAFWMDCLTILIILSIFMYLIIYGGSKNKTEFEKKMEDAEQIKYLYEQEKKREERKKKYGRRIK